METNPMSTPAPKSSDPTLTSPWPHLLAIVLGAGFGWIAVKTVGAAPVTGIVIAAVVTDAMHWLHAKFTD